MTRLSILMVAVALLATSCGSGVEEGASGETIFVQVCARCHADNLSGGFGPALVGADAASLNKPEAYFTQTVTSGLGRMPSFGGTLSELQIQRVVDYVLQEQGR